MTKDSREGAALVAWLNALADYECAGACADGLREAATALEAAQRENERLKANRLLLPEETQQLLDENRAARHESFSLRERVRALEAEVEELRQYAPSPDPSVL